jgi:phage antirepressor YoqD-like protein/phage regulator Rha-like protein
MSQHFPHNNRRPGTEVSAFIGGDAPVTMSSREIAELVESRHDTVKRTVDRCVERGSFACPPTVDVQEIGGNNRAYTTSAYLLDKRSSIIVVAQLCPEFTARLVDRWQELEAQAEKNAQAPAFDPANLLENPAAMRGLLLGYTEKVIELEARVEDMRGDVEALDRISNADGTLTVTETAKALTMRPSDLFNWLANNGWIYKRPGAALWLGYQSKCNKGLLWHKTTTIIRPDGSEKITEQLRVTAKGLTVLARFIKPVARIVSNPSEGN